ncbi:hypothetical protein [Methylobacterium soli]|uniref:Uncharacterized protein n=1 Tax=Methylobacterium soli TaxID=553447 RepID=A0A6L3ST61_9HYPH|nr:hypothetical protein [Methylobacterium soli]KAB1071108.1 hypothetical protein F6X53_29265 [Methylobacterium soli]GJE46597.1 hypothetical protein AEGHOMDF_5803 [Methylobacterium soli]
MTYTLRRLAPGSFDILLDGELVGGLVRNVSAAGHVHGWQAELLTKMLVTFPKPFIQPEHVFQTRAAALTWLGIPICARGSSRQQNVAKV